MNNTRAKIDELLAAGENTEAIRALADAIDEIAAPIQELISDSQPDNPTISQEQPSLARDSRGDFR